MLQFKINVVSETAFRYRGTYDQDIESFIISGHSPIFRGFFTALSVVD